MKFLLDFNLCCLVHFTWLKLHRLLNEWYNVAFNDILFTIVDSEFDMRTTFYLIVFQFGISKEFVCINRPEIAK